MTTLPLSEAQARQLQIGDEVHRTSGSDHQERPAVPGPDVGGGPRVPGCRLELLCPGARRVLVDVLPGYRLGAAVTRERHLTSRRLACLRSMSRSTRLRRADSIRLSRRYHHRQRSVTRTRRASLIAQGLHPRVIQARLGHASISETMDTYGHLFPDSDAETADALDRLFGDVPAR